MTIITNVCEICGKNFVTHCSRCTARVRSWGEEGAYRIVQMAKRTDDIQAEELLNFCMEYYIGKSKKRESVTTLKTSLKILGYSGGFIGRIHKNGMRYEQIRKREHEAGRRYRLLKDRCEKCGNTKELRLHHIVPISWGGLSSQENCITLCESCHRKTHKILSKVLNRELLLQYIGDKKDEIKKFAMSSIYDNSK